MNEEDGEIERYKDREREESDDGSGHGRHRKTRN
jgi:hypothetical protein